ncbi:hypothetical protein FGO68_gene10128 [Halteria grandinella]|uniref:Uncharacterized protein n=1 Tax=Halteria grandinella TaxID=5974 RepID=A0A8J8NW43_HALGN|nr:hypothetical protein FGO68_gene10128 [Halteria grandinella]
MSCHDIKETFKKTNFSRFISHILREDSLSLARLERRQSSDAVILNTKVVAVHLDSEKAVFSPVGAPRVPAHPVFSLGGLVESIAND